MGRGYNDAIGALKGVLRDGMSNAVDGLGICGIPEHCLRTIAEFEHAPDTGLILTDICAGVIQDECRAKTEASYKVGLQ